MPIILRKPEWQFIEYTSKVLHRAINKTIDACFASAHIRQYFSHEEVPKEWIEIDPGHEDSVWFLRFNILFNGRKLKFLEFCTETPDLWSWVDTIRSVFAESPFYQNILSKEKNVAPKYMKSLLDQTNQIYQKLYPTSTDLPHVAFLDYKENFSDDIKSMIDFFNQNGILALPADPRDFRIKDSNVYVGRKKIHIVYRNLKGQDLLKFPNQTKDFIQGYKNHFFHMLNSFRSCYGGEKMILALMTNPDYHHLYDEEEIDVIKKYLPWTRRLSDTNTRSPKDKKIHLGDFAKKYKNRVVLKPSWGQRGAGITWGKDIEQEEWEKLIDKHIGNKDWMLQEYISAPKISVPEFVGKKVRSQRKFFNLTAYLVHGNLAGVMARCSDNPVALPVGKILPVIYS